MQEVEVRTELVIEVFGLPVQGTRGDAPFSTLWVLSDARGSSAQKSRHLGQPCFSSSFGCFFTTSPSPYPPLTSLWLWSPLPGLQFISLLGS